MIRIPGHSKLSSDCIFWLLIAPLIFVTWHFRLVGYQEAIAWNGFSPVAWVSKVSNPDFFAKDFFSGIENFSKSSFMYIYILAKKVFAIKPENFLPIVVLFEYFFFTFALRKLFLTLRPEASLLKQFIISALVIVTYATHLDLGRFGAPHYIGQYYTFAHACRLLAIHYALLNFPSRAALLLALSMTTHPIIGFVGCFFVAIIWTIKFRHLALKQVFLACLIFTTIFGGWTFYQYERVAFSSSAIPVNVWLQMTQLLSFHWYPEALGTFSTQHTEYFFPMLAFLLIVLAEMGRQRIFRQHDREIFFGFVGVFFLTAIGLYVAYFVPSPFLIKLSLQRSSDIVGLIGICYVVNWLVDLILDPDPRPLMQALSLALLVSPFFFQPGFPVFLTMFALVCYRFLYRKNFVFNPRIVCLIGFTAVGTIAATVSYFKCGWIQSLDTPSYFGGVSLLLSLGGAYTLFKSINLIPVIRNQKLFIPIVAISFLFAIKRDLRRPEILNNTEPLAAGFLAAQKWARMFSPVESLFFIDPVIIYGWRDFSERSSFGNYREWLHTSWLYDSSYSWYLKGMERFGEFNIDLSEYVDQDPPINNPPELFESIREKFYSYDDNWRLYMSKKYDINYFVMRKSMIKSPSTLPIVFENEDFVILESKNR